MPVTWQIIFGSLPLILTILGAAVHLGIRIGRFQQVVNGVAETQKLMAVDLDAHIQHDEKLFAELNASLRSYADSLNRLIGAVGGKVS